MLFLISDEDGGSFTQKLSVKISMSYPNSTMVCISPSEHLFRQLERTTQNVMWVQTKFRWLSVSQLFQVLKLLHLDDSKTVFATGYVAHTVGIILGFCSRKKNRVFVRHFTDSHHSLRKLHWFILDILVNSLASRIIVVSQRVLDLMQTIEMVKPEKIHIIENPIDIELFHQVRIQNSQENIVPHRVILVGRQTRGKGFLTAIDAFTEFVDLYDNVHLDLFGESSDLTAEIIVRLQRLSSSKYTVHGKVYDKRLIYSKASVLIHVPERPNFESFGLVYVEGLAAGLQCIFSESGILNKRSVPFTDDYIWFVPHNDKVEIVKRLTTIFLDNEQKKPLPLNSLEHLAEDSVINRYINVIKPI